MKLSVALAIVALATGLVAVTQASAADRAVSQREHRITVVRGAQVRGTAARLPPLALRTVSRRFASVMDSTPCWRGCTAQCGATFQYCIRGDWLAGCMVQSNACDRACQVQCRPIGGPLVSWTDY
jgi:hypothetical protein